MQHGILVTFFGKQRDRFCTYQKGMTIVEKLERAAKVFGATGVELIFPEECEQPVDLKSLLRRLNLLPAAINVNIKGHQDFVSGALTSPHAKIRRRAVETILEAKEFARELGCDRVTCAPLADGYDYPFQVNYERSWKHMVECLRDAADSVPEVTLHLEHKPSDPRITGFLDSAAKVLCLYRDIGRPNVGITFNLGHSLVGGGWPAAEFCRIVGVGLPCYIHYNDGLVHWDWDLIVGSQNLWRTVEFLFYVRESGYDGWFTADTLALRQDAVDVFAANIRVTERILEWFDLTDLSTFRESIQGGATHRVLEEITGWVCQRAS